MATPAAVVGIRRRRRERKDGGVQVREQCGKGARGLKHISYSTREGEGAGTGPIGHSMAMAAAGFKAFKRGEL
jgi:hypothetical protein